MPWTATDALGHTKQADTPKKQRGWAKAANARLKACLADGGDQDECEASAVKVANAAVTKMEEQEEPVGPDICECPDCDYETKKKRGTPCRSMTCPDCDAKLVAKTGSEGETEEVMVRIPVLSVPVDGENVAVGELIAAYRKMHEAKTKTVAGKARPAGDFLVVEDSDKPTTWHLPVKVNGKPDHRLMGGAWAALHEGYRGNKYEGPGKAKAIAKLKALYKSEDMPLPTSEFDFIEGVSATTVRQVLGFLLEQMSEGAEEVAEVELAESASGAALQLAEALPAADGNRAPLLLDVALIKPGWGNKRDNRYYPAEMLKRDAKIFEGVKMYTTNHREGEKSVRTEVSQIQGIIGFTDGGAPIAKVAIHDPDFAEATRNRARLNTLTSLECSILATGRVKAGKIDGKKANVVEAIVSAQSVDWVTRAGAGGHALNLAETDGGNDMSDKEQQQENVEEVPVEETRETVLSEAGQEQEAPKPLAGDAVEVLLKASSLPGAAQKRLAEAEYKGEVEVKTAITAEVEYLKTITGSGKPFGQGGGQPAEETRISEADVQKRFDEIDRQHGLYVAQEVE